MKFHDSLPNYDWDQMLPIGVTTEQLYQAFKARLMRELYAKCPNCVSYEGEQRTEGALLREKADATAGRG